jgi:hypothetical protein
LPKITFTAGEVFPADDLARFTALNKALGLPQYGTEAGTKPRLAVVGGSPSVAEFADELRAWSGDVWAINGAFGWCLEKGIEATFFTLDASSMLVDMARRASSAILADHCHPAVVHAVRGDIRLVRLEGTPLGCTSAASAPMLAAQGGYEGVTLFGCASSFNGDSEHAYAWSATTPSRVLVECGGQEYLTTPPLIMQAEYLSDIARQVPGYLEVRGSGLLPALIEHGEYEVLKVSRDLMKAATRKRRARA